MEKRISDVKDVWLIIESISVKITVIIGKYLETLFILMKYMQLVRKHP